MGMYPLVGPKIHRPVTPQNTPTTNTKNNINKLPTIRLNTNNYQQLFEGNQQLPTDTREPQVQA